MSFSKWADRVVMPLELTVSPHGEVCFVRSSVDVPADRRHHSLWLHPQEGAGRQLTDGPDDRFPTWSPDGKAVAFVRSPAGLLARLALLEVASGTVKEIVTSHLPVGPVSWAPDGRRLAFVGALPMIDEPSAPIVVRRLGYRADGRGLLGERHDRLVIVDLDTGQSTQLGEDGWRITSCAWSPPGDEIAFTAVPGEYAEQVGGSRAYVASVARADDVPAPISPAAGQARAVVWTLAGPAWVGKGHADPGQDTLLLRGPGTEHPIDLLCDVDRSVVTGGPGYPGGRPVPVHDGRGVVVCVREGGGTQLLEAPVDRSSQPRLLGGDEAAYITAFDTDHRDGGVVVSVARADSTGELERWGAHSVEALTHVSADSRCVATRVQRERRRFSTSDGRVVSAWLLRPDRTGPAPLLVDLHGGPHNAWSPAPSPAYAHHLELVNRGWTILLPDPRGSDGYGEEHLLANLGRWGSGDGTDVLEPISALVEEGVADPDRMAVHGYSYGGYLACWLTTKTDRFAAAIAGGCIADTTSMATSDAAGELYADLGAAPWTDAAKVDAQSPYRRVERVSTPTLLLHGLADDTCPPHQAEQWFSALRAQGVPTEMILYPKASHGFLHVGLPSHRRDYCARVVDWLERHVGMGT